MAISASVLNQLQEVEIDSKMKRTQDRPLPAGKISSQQAIIFFFSHSAVRYCSYLLLRKSHGCTHWFIYCFLVQWDIYYAKRITAFAVVPGAVTGALPPLIGWVAAGGGVWEKSIIFVEFMFFIGQVPHFWLLIMKYGEEYEKAGIPSLTGILSRSQINRLTFTWVVTSVIAALFLCHFGIIRSGFITGILIFSIVNYNLAVFRTFQNAGGKEKFQEILVSSLIHTFSCYFCF